MDEIIEISNIVRFLTKQNINHDMQNEILSYYKSKMSKTIKKLEKEIDKQKCEHCSEYIKDVDLQHYSDLVHCDACGRFSCCDGDGINIFQHNKGTTYLCFNCTLKRCACCKIKYYEVEECYECISCNSILCLLCFNNENYEKLTDDGFICGLYKPDHSGYVHEF